jgi:hypothetical protein
MAIYFISSNGSDLNDGLSQNTPWNTIEKVNQTISGGDTVCFRRGDTFFGLITPPRNNTSLFPTTYTSYGEGPKPIVSQYKTVLPDSWEDYGNNVWRLNLKNASKFTGNVTELDTNVGFLKIDGRIMPRNTFSLENLDQTWDFCCDDQYVYVKAEVSPSFLAKDIKLTCNINCMRFADNLLVENIIFKGTGAHGISGTVHNATIRGCEFHEIGGSILPTYHAPNIRYGNGIECWTDSSDVLVEHCHFSGIYDVALTMQGSGVKKGWTNISFKNNVIWNCQQAFEIWSKGKFPDTGFKNCVFENNVCIDSGYCWGYDVRPNKDCSCHLLMYGLECPICDITIRNNTFYRARVTPIFKSGGPSFIPDSYIITDNVFYVEPHQNIVLSENNDIAYQSFYEKISSKNHIIESTF